MKINAIDPQVRTEVLQIAEHYKAKVVDFGSESLVLRVYGESEKVDSFIGLLQAVRHQGAGPFGQDPDGPRPPNNLGHSASGVTAPAAPPAPE